MKYRKYFVLHRQGPAALVEQEKAKLALNQQKLEQVENRLAELKESL